jgi:hypothetical protein
MFTQPESKNLYSFEMQHDFQLIFVKDLRVFYFSPVIGCPNVKVACQCELYLHLLFLCYGEGAKALEHKKSISRVFDCVTGEGKEKGSTCRHGLAFGRAGNSLIVLEGLWWFGDLIISTLELF